MEINQKRPYNWCGNKDKWCEPLREYMLSLDPAQQDPGP
jgi:hypothetical protein